ncbi:MAG: hypothetical protein WC910_11395 [Bacteroidales bacterium]
MPTQAMDAAIVANTHCHRCHQPLAEYRRKSEGGMMCHNSIRICKNKQCEEYINLAGTGWHETAADWEPEKIDVKMATAMLGIVPGEMKRQGLENAKKFGRKW